MNFPYFRLSLLLASAVIFPATGFSQARYIVDSATTVTNGSFANTLDGNDWILITASGAINMNSPTVAWPASVMVTGNDNNVRNLGTLSGSIIQSTGDFNTLENSGIISNIGAGSRVGVDFRTENDVATPRTYSIGSVVLNKVNGRIEVESTDFGLTRGVHTGIRSRFINEVGASITAKVGGTSDATGLLIGADADLNDDAIAGDDRPIIHNYGTITTIAGSNAVSRGIRSNVAAIIENIGSIFANSDTGTAMGISFAGIGSGSKIVNDIGANIRVRSGILSGGQGVGIRAFWQQANNMIRNDGTIDVAATSGAAMGIWSEAISPTILLGSRSNILVSSDGELISSGVRMHGTDGVFNMSSGANIDVSAGIGAARGLHVVSVRASMDVNGTITATNRSNNPFFPVQAVLLENGEGMSFTLGSSGSVSAVSEGSTTGAALNISSASGSKVSIAGSLSSKTGNGSSVSALALSSTSGSSILIKKTGKLKTINRRGNASHTATIDIYNSTNIRVENDGTIMLETEALSADGMMQGVLLSVRNSPQVTFINSGQMISDDDGLNINRNSSRFEFTNTGLLSVANVALSSEIQNLDGFALSNSGVIKSSSGNLIEVSGMTLVNSGSLLGSISNNQRAILASGTVDLTFNKGSSVIGEIVLNGADNRIRIDGRGRSARWLFNGRGSIEGAYPEVKIDASQALFYAQSGKEVLIVDRQNLNQSVILFDELSQNVSQLLGLRRFELLNGSSSGKTEAIWAEVGGGDRRSSSVFGNKQVVSGVVGFDEVAGQWVVGGIFGYNTGSMEMRDDFGDQFWKKSLSGVVLGAHALGYFDQSSFIHAALLCGILGQNDSRYMSDHMVDTGTQILQSSYNGYWVSPEVTLGGMIQSEGKRVRVKPSLGFSYTYALIPSYEEGNPVLQSAGGSWLALSHGRQDIGLVSTHAALEVEYIFSNMNIGTYAGYQYKTALDSTDVTLNFGGQESRSKPDSVGWKGLYAGLNLLLSLSEKSNIAFGSRVSQRDDSRLDTEISGGLSMVF